VFPLLEPLRYRIAGRLYTSTIEDMKANDNIRQCYLAL
jgi:hypothetical protein